MALLKLGENLKLALPALPIFKIQQKQSGAPKTRVILKIKTGYDFGSFLGLKSEVSEFHLNIFRKDLGHL